MFGEPLGNRVQVPVRTQWRAPPELGPQNLLASQREQQRRWSVGVGHVAFVGARRAVHLPGCGDGRQHAAQGRFVTWCETRFACAGTASSEPTNAPSSPRSTASSRVCKP